ncbi:MAG: hypothetical protein ABIB04_02295 [Patescibacteria group bacterium]
MRNIFLALALSSLIVAGAGCSKKEENPYQDLVPTGGSPSMPTEPKEAPVIPPEARNVPLPNPGT